MKKSPSKLPGIDPTALMKALLAAADFPPYLVATSPDLVRLRRIEGKVREKLAVGSDQITKLRGEELSHEAVTKIHDELVSLSLFSGARLIIINSIDRTPQGSQKSLAATLAQSAPGITVLCLGAPILASNPLAQAAKKDGRYLAFPELEGQELTQWAAREFVLNGIKDPPKAVVDSVIDLASNSPDRISGIVSQLALYLDGEPITAQTMSELYPSSVSAGEFELIDSIFGGSVARTEVLFETLIKAGKSPFMLLGMLSKILGNYQSIRSLLDRKIPPQTIREQLNMSPWIFNKSLDAARRIAPRSLEKQLQAIVRADSKLKNRSLGPEIIYSELFFALRPPASREQHA